MNRFAPTALLLPLGLALFLLPSCGGRSDLLDFVDPAGEGGGSASHSSSSASTGTGSSQGGAGGAPSSGTGGAGAGPVIDCSLGQVVELASEQTKIKRIALDETHVYWLDEIKGTTHVLKMPKSGGTATTLAKIKGFPRALVVDDTNVYWAIGVTSEDHQIYSIKKDGDPSNTKKKLASMIYLLYDLAVDADHLYWIHSNGVTVMPKGGGAPLDLVSGGYSMRHLAMDADRVYWMEGVGTELRSIPKGGGSPSLLASTMSESFGFAVGDTALYFNDRDHGRMVAVPKVGGALADVAGVAGPDAIVMGVAVDASCVYWTTVTYNTVMEDHVWAAPKGGGPAVAIATGTEYRVAITADESGVYWGDDSTGTLMKLAK